MMTMSKGYSRMAQLAPLAILCWATSGSSGCGCGPSPGSQTVVSPTANSQDKTYCDVQAVRCSVIQPCETCNGQPVTLPNGQVVPGCVSTPTDTCVVGSTPQGCALNNAGLPSVPCSCTGTDLTTCTCDSSDLSLLGQGAPTCFNHVNEDAKKACNNLCDPNQDANNTPPTGPAYPGADYPAGLRQFCSGASRV